MTVIVSPPVPKTDQRFDDWMYLFWKRVFEAIADGGGGGSLGPFTDHSVILADSSSTIASLASLGTTTTVLHGNPSDDPSWGPVSLSADVAGNLPVTNLNDGIDADSSTVWYGDGTWREPGPPSSLYLTTINYIQNSLFQVRNNAEQASVDFATSAPYSQHVRRWYGYCEDAGFRTEAATGADFSYIAIKRHSGSSQAPVRLVQILDTEDSIPLSNTVNKAVVIRIGKKNTSSNIDSVNLIVTKNSAVNESLDDYITDSWTDPEQILNATPFVNEYLNSSSYYLDFGTVKQLAVEVQVTFGASVDAVNDEVWISYILLNDGIGATYMDSKSLAVAKHECNRYYQELELYLTDSFISVPINMRAVPSITLGDAAAFTTTGTTKDALIIKVNSSSDNGIHTVYLDCEL